VTKTYQSELIKLFTTLREFHLITPHTSVGADVFTSVVVLTNFV